MLGRVIFGPDGDMQHIQSFGISPFLICLQRQVSYFGYREAVDGLLKHLGNYKLCHEILCILWEDRLVENILYRSFYE